MSSEPLPAAPCSLPDSHIPDDCILGSISYGDVTLIEYLDPKIPEQEKLIRRKNWLEEAERKGGIENQMKSSPLYGSGVIQLDEFLAVQSLGLEPFEHLR